jgi:hypothetical protein
LDEKHADSNSLPSWAKRFCKALGNGTQKSCLEITPGLSSHGGHLLRDATRWQVMFLSKPRPKYSGSGCILCEI